MILPATHISQSSPILNQAARRGLVLAQHHFQVLGADLGRLSPSDKKCYSIVTHPEETIQIWRQAIRANRHRETVWTLGYRGSNDRPFWFDEPGKFTDRQKGQIISKAIRIQWELLHSELRKADIPCVYYLYRENQVLYQQGYIEIPTGVQVIWCDNGHGNMETYFRDNYELWGMGQGPLPPSKGRTTSAWPEKKGRGGGLYYHVSFYDGIAPNRVEFVSPNQIQKNLSKAHQLGLNFFMLLNVGNIRDFQLGIGAVFSFIQSPKRWLTQSSDPSKFLLKWCQERFGRKYAVQAVIAFEGLFGAHWWVKTSPGKCFGDNAVCNLMRDLFSRMTSGEFKSMTLCNHWPGLSAADGTRKMLPEALKSQQRWSRAMVSARKLYQKLPSEERTAFFRIGLVPIQRGMGAISTWVACLKATEAIESGKSEVGQDYFQEAEAALDEWEKALASTDAPPKWRGWSKSDRIVKTSVIHVYIQSLKLWSSGVSLQSRLTMELFENLKKVDPY